MLRHRATPVAGLFLVLTLGASILFASTGGSFSLITARYGAGSAGASTGGAFSVEGSAGDPSVTESHGAPFHVAGGFWSGIYGHRTGVDGQPPDAPPRVFAFPAPAPNPFNPRTSISFDLPTAQFVNLRIYNVRGELVNTLVEERREAGHYQVEWNGRDRNARSVASGVYLVQIKAGPHSGQHKISLVK